MMRPQKSGFFTDSNIWLYALSQQTNNPPATQKRSIAIELIRCSGIVVSFQVINEACVNARKKLGFTDSDITALIQDFYQGCTVIESSQQLLTLAAALREHYLFSFWDSLIVSAALQAEVPVLYSEDMQHELIVNKQLKIVNPFI